MFRLKEEYKVREVCSFYKISRQGYYKQLKVREERLEKDESVVRLVHKARSTNKNLGVKKIYHKFKDAIHDMYDGLGRDKLFSLLRSRGLLVKRSRKYAVTTQSRHRFRKYDNKLKEMRVSRTHQAWVADLTYIRTRQGFVYLFLITDHYSRKIVGWELNKSMGIESALQAAKMAIKQCRSLKGLVHHSDRGFQYCAPSYSGKLESLGITMSMGEVGNCYENAIAERVNGILKGEYGLDETFSDYQEALKSTREAIKDYNEQRPHWSLKLQIPSVIHAA